MLGCTPRDLRAPSGARTREKPLRRLIVNADDLGLTEGVNRAIGDAHARGIVTSTTLLANGAAFEGAAAMVRETPGLSVGAHLNLTQGAPMLPAKKVASLVDATGNFRFVPQQLWRAIATRRVRGEEIDSELRAQVEKLLNAGLRITHLDGHMHVHVVPPVAERVIRLAKEYGIAAMRCPVESLSDIFFTQAAPQTERRTARARFSRQAGGRRGSAGITGRRAIGLAVSALAKGLRKKLDRAGIAYPAHFFGTAQTGRLNERVLEKHLRSLPTGTSELCCHPGYLSEELLAEGGALTTQREEELLALTAPKIKTLAADRGIALITYRDLSIAGSR